MECVQIDLNNVCRTCKNESPEMKSLYYRDSESGKENPRLDEMLMACASVQVNNEDGLPKTICQSCFIQLKNAYSFKEQCEKTDSFLRNYLQSLKKESIKQEIMTDMEFTSNFIVRINDGIENKNDGAEPHSDEARRKDVDFVQVVDNNLTIYDCQTCSKVFYTLEGLTSHKRIHTDNNIVHYIKMDIDDNTNTCSGQSDGGSGDDLVIDEEDVKPEVQTSEDNDQEKNDETVRIANEIYTKEDPLDMLEETKIEVEVNRMADEPEVDHGNGYQSGASTHSVYLPTKQTPPKVKRGRGRPRKYPVSPKPTGRPRGRPSLSEKEIGNFPCPQCKEVFTNMRLLEKHAEQHDGLQIYECDACNKKFPTRNTLKQHKQSHVDGRPFPCKVCGKCFKFKNNLQRHAKLHLRGDVHPCNLCEAVFNLPRYLAEHKNLMHKTDEKKYKCQFCQRGFAAENYRDLHMKVHYDDGKFHCRTCEKTFTSKSHLMKHMSFHNNNFKKFLCSECGEGFIRHDYLVTHMRRHRGEKPFKCKFCERGFTRSADLTAHERYHTGETTHLCVVCGRGFGRACDYRVHMRTHTGEKPYRCTYCDAAFTQNYVLKAHMRRHTGERFPCELCPRTFLAICTLTQHKRIDHGLNIDSNIKRLRRINKLDPDDAQPVIDSDPLQTELSEVKEEISEVKQEVLELKQEQQSDMM